MSQIILHLPTAMSGKNHPMTVTFPDISLRAKTGDAINFGREETS
jgi:hypothetical protein